MEVLFKMNIRSNMENSKVLFEKSLEKIPGGVNSPVRAFGSVGGSPLFIKSANADHIYDVDGNEFIDYVCSWGPGILGHAHPQVIEAVKKACVDGLTFGAPTKKELELAELITDAMPSIEKVRLVNSGTEATMSAIRTARGYTGRDMIIKFRGNYHGHSDGLLVKAGSAALTTAVGLTPKYSCAPPNLSLNPVITSSNIRTVPYFNVISRRNFKNPSFGGTTPILAATGSTMIAATFSPYCSISSLTESSLLYSATRVFCV